MSRRVEAAVGVPVTELVRIRSTNKSSRARIVPLLGDAEVYFKPSEGKIVLRKKTSKMPALPQMQALRVCAAKLKEANKKDEIKSRADVYKFMDECMKEEGFD